MSKCLDFHTPHSTALEREALQSQLTEEQGEGLLYKAFCRQAGLELTILLPPPQVLGLYEVWPCLRKYVTGEGVEL